MKRPLLHALLFALAVALIGFLLLQQTAPAAISAQDGDAEPWRSSAAPVDGLSPQQLSPPDAPRAHSGAETEAAQPQAPAGVVLHDFRIPGSVLRPRASTVGYYWGAGGGCIYNTSGSAAEIFNTPLILPDGALINTVRMYYDDQSGLNSAAWISVYDLYGILEAEWVMTSTGDSGPGFADTSVINHRVDYGVHSYALNWRPNEQGNEMQLCGFRVYYEAPPFSFLPLVSGG